MSIFFKKPLKKVQNVTKFRFFAVFAKFRCMLCVERAKFEHGSALLLC